MPFIRMIIINKKTTNAAPLKLKARLNAVFFEEKFLSKKFPIK